MCFGFGFNRCCRFRNEEFFGDFRRCRCHCRCREEESFDDFRRRRFRFEESSSEFCRAVRRCNRRPRREREDI